MLEKKYARGLIDFSLPGTFDPLICKSLDDYSEDNANWYAIKGLDELKNKGQSISIGCDKEWEKTFRFLIPKGSESAEKYDFVTFTFVYKK